MIINNRHIPPAIFPPNQAPTFVNAPPHIDGHRSVLSRILCSVWEAPTPEVTPITLEDFDAIPIKAVYTPPKYSSDYLHALNVFYLKRDQILQEYEDMLPCEEQDRALIFGWMREAWESHDPHSALRLYIKNGLGKDLLKLANIVNKCIPLTSNQKLQQRKFNRAFLKRLNAANASAVAPITKVVAENLTQERLTIQTAPSTILLAGGYQLCNDCGTVIRNGEHSRVFLDWKAWLRRYVHLVCRLDAVRHEPLGIVSKSGKVYGTKLTTLDVQFQDGEEEAFELKGEVEAAFAGCYERSMDERYDRSLQEVLDKRQSELGHAPVWIVDKITGKRMRESSCKRCKGPIEKRKGTTFCSDNCRKRYFEETK